MDREDNQVYQEYIEFTSLCRVHRDRVLRDRIDHVLIHSDWEFTKRFRLTKEGFHHLLEALVEIIKPPTTSGVSTSSASRFVKVVTEAICTLKKTFLAMPSGEEVGQVMNDFYRIAQFPSVVGTLDCTHVTIQSPEGDQAEYYRNRKGYFSYNVQTVSDANLKIRDIVARWPGSAHDVTIFNNSILCTQFESGRFANGLLLEIFVLTPLDVTNSAAERLYNESQIRTRNTVERSYGLWKRRFPVLRLEIRLAISRVQALIVATAILHNMCIDLREESPPVDEAVQWEVEQALMNIPNNTNGMTDYDAPQNDSQRQSDVIEHHLKKKLTDEAERQKPVLGCRI